MNNKELRIIKQLDDGTLYAASTVIEELFRYPDMENARLLVSRDNNGKATGYLPVGNFRWNPVDVLSYIPAMSNSPPISATYTPGAEHVLADLSTAYIDNDIVADLDHNCSQQEPTASAFCLPFDDYWKLLSAARRKDFRRKLNAVKQFIIREGNLNNIEAAWPWMQQIWEQRGRFGCTPYETYLEETLSWFRILKQSQRATLKIDTYLQGKQLVGVNCCVIHKYAGNHHCDDYLTWYDPEIASGLGIVSAINNLTHPKMTGFRYNLGSPGFLGKTYGGHEYKWHIIPEGIRLTQSVFIKEDSGFFP